MIRNKTTQLDLPRESSLEFIRAKHSESNVLAAHYKEKKTNKMHSIYAILFFFNILIHWIVSWLQ